MEHCTVGVMVFVSSIKYDLRHLGAVDEFIIFIPIVSLSSVLSSLKF